MDTSAIRTRPLVLVVDDDEDLRRLSELQLGEGFDVIQAENGARCVSLADSERPDVILLDMMMPGMDGTQVVRELATKEGTKDIPVIFLSALGGVANRVAGLETGAVDYIQKPVDSRELVARVGVAARSSARQRPLAEVKTLGLPERGAFEERLGQELSRCERSSAELSVMLLRLDRPTAEEIAQDPEAGQALHDVAGLIRTQFRRADGVYIYEANAFAAILPDTDIATATLAAERCRGAAGSITYKDRSITLSIGMAEFTTGKTTESLIARAEIALFRAAESGGDRVWRDDDPRKRPLNPLSLSQELTDREWDVLGHLANRRTEQDIGRRMGIRPGTVRSHKARIRRKLHVDPDIRLSEFARTHFNDLVGRLERLSADDPPDQPSQDKS